MDGVARASITFRALCVCNSCGRKELSSSTNRFDIDLVGIAELSDAISSTVDSLFIDPPLDWAVYGRGKYKCHKCMKENKNGK